MPSKLTVVFCHKPEIPSRSSISKDALAWKRFARIPFWNWSSSAITAACSCRIASSEGRSFQNFFVHFHSRTELFHERLRQGTARNNRPALLGFMPPFPQADRLAVSPVPHPTLPESAAIEGTGIHRHRLAIPAGRLANE
jgi:hypothetical protein